MFEVWGPWFDVLWCLRLRGGDGDCGRVGSDDAG